MRASLPTSPSSLPPLPPPQRPCFVQTSFGYSGRLSPRQPGTLFTRRRRSTMRHRRACIVAICTRGPLHRRLARRRYMYTARAATSASLAAVPCIQEHARLVAPKSLPSSYLSLESVASGAGNIMNLTQAFAWRSSPCSPKWPRRHIRKGRGRKFNFPTRAPPAALRCVKTQSTRYLRTAYCVPRTTLFSSFFFFL